MQGIEGTFVNDRGVNCPHCHIPLQMTERQGIEIDYCPQCRGVWLDRGELDKLIEHSVQITAQMAQPQRQAPPQMQQPMQAPPAYQQPPVVYQPPPVVYQQPVVHAQPVVHHSGGWLGEIFGIGHHDVHHDVHHDPHHNSHHDRHHD